MDDVSEFERMLGARRSDLAEELGALASRLAALRVMREADNDDEHDPDGAPVSAEWSRLTGIRLETERELTATDAALARLAAGEYGLCASCGRQIGRARLEARPTATLCIACAERTPRP